MPEVGQNTTLRALASMRQGREEEISTFIRRFNSVCLRYVGTMLNNDTLKQFFIRWFIKSGTIRSVLEMNPRTLVEVKAAAREVDQLDKDYERLWRRDDELIPQFIPICPKALEGATISQVGQVPYVPIEAGSRPLAVKNPEPLLVLPARRVDPQIEEVERRLGASQVGFQEAMMKQLQSLTDQLALVIRSQQPRPPPQAESRRHATRMWCVQCKQHGHTSQYCKTRQNQDERNNGAPQQ